MGTGLSTNEYANQVQSDLAVLGKLSGNSTIQQQTQFVLQPISIQYARKDAEQHTQSNSAFQSAQNSLKQSNSRLQSVIQGLSSGNLSSNSMNMREEDSFRLDIQLQPKSGRDFNIGRLISSIRESVGRASLQSIKGEIRDVELPE